MSIIGKSLEKHVDNDRIKRRKEQQKLIKESFEEHTHDATDILSKLRRTLTDINEKHPEFTFEEITDNNNSSK